MYLNFGGNTYFVHEKASSWADAEDFAADSGGALAKISSKAENTAIADYLKNQSKTWDNHLVAGDGGNAEYVWLGGNDIKREGDWSWSDGSKVTYDNWGYGNEPDNFNNQDAMAMGLEEWPSPGGGLGNPGQWNDIDVSNRLYSVIEMSGLVGTAGRDKITGTNKGDDFSSVDGTDTLFGLGGADQFIAGRGGDQIHGGGGGDTFIYEDFRDSSTQVTDRIFDFSHQEGDRIDLSLVVNGKFHFIGEDSFSGDRPEVRYEISQGQTTVWVDQDPTGKPELAIIFDGKIDFVASDFLL